MRRVFKYFFVSVFAFLFFIGDSVAIESSVYELIPVGSTLDVVTEHFVYNSVRLNGNLLEFEAVNFGSVKAPVSISVALFDENKKNVGMVNYCSTKDYDSSFANTKLAANDWIYYSIVVKDKYFGKKKGLNDVKYISVIGDNAYCKVGGASNYLGKTIEEIKPKDMVTNSDLKENNTVIDNMLDKVLGKIDLSTIVSWVVLFFIYFIFSTLVNTLSFQMYRKGNLLSWIPLLNVYLGIKFSFGGIVSLTYLIIVLVCGLIGFSLMKSVLLIGVAIASVVVIIKIITKKYDLFVIGGSNIKLSSYNKDFSTNKNNPSQKVETSNPLVDFMKNIAKREVLDDDDKKDDFKTSPFNWNQQEDDDNDDDLGQFL